MSSSIPPGGDWIPAALNRGWTYTHRVAPVDAGRRVVDLLASRYTHSTVAIWKQRLLAGELQLNGESLAVDQSLRPGDSLSWHRPPWREPAVPANWQVLFDDGDLLVIDKPSGLPVIAGGGFLEHTLMGLLQRRTPDAQSVTAAIPVHRLGRFTSGVMLCARERRTRAELAAMFQRGTAGLSSGIKIYRALARSSSRLQANERVAVELPIAEHNHPLHGRIWGIGSSLAQPPGTAASTGKQLRAFSTVQLLERRADADLLEVTISTGRPHQIRIHLAAMGSPLIGDPLYGVGGVISPFCTVGEGGYLLHSHRLQKLPYQGRLHDFEAVPPAPLQIRDAGSV